MSRPAIATLTGIAGFLAYVVLVLLLADHVRALHWTIELLFFAVAGIAWVWPAKPADDVGGAVVAGDEQGP